jgi:large subunit ribosomal protein L25
VTCLPKDLPEEITLDLSQMKLNESKYISDIPLPAGVVATAVMQGKDQVVVSIHSPRAEEPETPAAEAAAAATAAPAADAKKEEPKKEGAKK